MSFSRKRSRAFTLIEVLMAVMLAGIIASLALAPVIYSVRQVVDTETAYSDETALRRAAAFMAQDVAAGLRLAPTVLRLVHHESLSGGDDDTLIVASAAPAKQNLAAGSIVYKLVEGNFMNDRYVPGLYRWLLPGVLPKNVEHDKLEEKDGQLVIPYVTNLKLAAYRQNDWADEYDGKLPLGMKFTLARGEESVEYVFGLPQ